MDHITKLSVELLELIISTILDPGDLFNLALACKLLHNLILPHHVYFRELTTEWNYGDSAVLWDMVHQRPILTRHIHTLQIGVPWDHNGLRLAKSRARVLGNAEWMEKGSLSQETLGTIPQSISRMANLRKFLLHGSMIPGESTLWSCIHRIFDGLDNFPNLTSLTINTGEREKHFALSLPARQLSFLTSLALTIPCLCTSCASISFYQKLLFAQLDSLQDVQLNFPPTYLHPEFPKSHQWSRVFKKVKWPNIRRFTLNPCGNYLSKSTPILETFLTRHPLMESFAFYGGAGIYGESATLNLSFALKNPSKLHSLKYVFTRSCRSGTMKELARVSDLQFPDVTFHDEEVESLGSLPNLRFCNLVIGAQTFLARFVELFPGVEKLDVHIKNSFGMSELKLSNYITTLEGLNKLTHLGGLLRCHGYQNDQFLKTAAETVPSLTHVEICHNQRQVWALIERNAEGEYSGYKASKLDRNNSSPNWGLFFFGIP